MLVIAVTGGIGSGKSTAAELFQIKGIPVIDTDSIARELVQPGTPLLQQIITEFGETYRNDQGGLDRRAMRELIFNDSRARSRLETILHPQIHAQVMASLAKVHAPYALLLIPLLANSTHSYPYDRVLLVDAPDDVRIQRTSQRDHQDPGSVRRIIQSQAPRETLIAMADDILDNSGDLEQLRDSVDRLHRHYLHLAGTKH